MVDIQTISIMLASASVIAGVVYYAFQIRLQTKVRKTDLAIRLSPGLNLSGDVLTDAIAKVWTMKYKDYDDFVEKYGPFPSEKPELKALTNVEEWFDSIGLLVKENILDIDLAWKLYGGWYVRAWEMLKPVIEGRRKRLGNPASRRDFEYLANELKKYEQKLQQRGIKNG